MFCPYCGAQLPAEALFCNRCGRHLELPPPQESASLASPSHPAVSGLAGPVAQQQDGLYSSPSGFQYPQTDPGLSASPILLPFASSLPTMYETAESASSRGIAPSPELPPVRAPRQRRRRRLWMVLSSVVVALLLLALWGGFAYLNRSTPAKTVATVCQALKNHDFPTVYEQFSTALRSRLGPEPNWASGRQQDYSRQGGLTNCTVSSVSENGSPATGVVTLTFGNGRVEEDRVRLLDAHGSWVIQQTAIKTAVGSISEFALPAADSEPGGIVASSDGNLWFTEFKDNKIGRISSSGSLSDFSGSISEFALPTAKSYPAGIALGPDGNLWFTEASSDKIGRISSNGSISEFALSSANSWPLGIVLGPDGNLWFTEASGNKIARISSSGSISEFALPTADSRPIWITLGSDGNFWFTEASGDKIGRISSSGGISEFALPTANSDPEWIAAGPDGNLWFTEAAGNKIGRISTNGSISEFALPATDSDPAGIVASSDGNLWFTEFKGNKIGRISTSGSVTEFALPTADSQPECIVGDPDGNLWFTEFDGNKIGRIGSS